jgi:hypothetical protein
VQHKRTVFVVLCGIIVLGWIFVAAFTGPLDVVPGGLLLGTIFGQVALSAAWAALGPLPLKWRWPLAATWQSCLTLAVGVNIASEDDAPLMILFVVGGSMLGQWLLLQALLWGLATFARVQVADAHSVPIEEMPNDRQFGIRQLLLLTLLVAVVLGAGRLLLGGMRSDSFEDWTEVLLIFGSIALAEALLALPLIIAPLLPKGASIACLGSLVVLAVGTTGQTWLMDKLVPGGATSGYWMYGSLNVSVAAWILGCLLMLRRCGFRLVSRGTAAASDSLLR